MDIYTNDNYLNIDDMFYSLFTEAVSTEETTLIMDAIYPRIENVLNTPHGDRKFKDLVGGFIDRNSKKLFTSGPVYNIPFTDKDKNDYFTLFGIKKEEVNEVLVQVTKSINDKSNVGWKLIRQNPIFSIFFATIRFYTLKKDEKGLNTALSIYALSGYWSVFDKYFKVGANEGVMNYTIDNLTEKYIFKQAGHVFGALLMSIRNSYSFFRNEFASPKTPTDSIVIRFIQRIRNDQNSLIKHVCSEYMANYKKGASITDSKESFDGTQLVDDNLNNTSIVAQISEKISLAFVKDGIDISRASIAARLAGVSISDTRFYLLQIFNTKNNDDISKFVQAVLFIFLYDEKHKPEDINSRNFLIWSTDLFRRTNSNNANVYTIKSTLDKWAENAGIHSKFKREASRVSYKKAIFFYIIISIQYYNNI